MCRESYRIHIAQLLIVITVIAFWQLHENDFVNYDDFSYVVMNPNVCHGLCWKGVSWALVTTANSNWHPLTWLSLQADYELYGLNRSGFHRTNLLFHIANVLVLSY